MIIGEKIRELREGLGWSQAKLAAEVRVSQPTIASIEKGTQTTSRALPRIASLFNVEVSALDPDYPMGTPLNEGLDVEATGTAFEVMIEALRPDFDAADRRALARVFLDLVQEPLDDKIDAPLFHQMRLRLQFVIRPFLQK